MRILRTLLFALFGLSFLAITVGDWISKDIQRWGLFGIGGGGIVVLLITWYSNLWPAPPPIPVVRELGVLEFPTPTPLIASDLLAPEENISIASAHGRCMVRAHMLDFDKTEVLNAIEITAESKRLTDGTATESTFQLLTESGLCYIGSALSEEHFDRLTKFLDTDEVILAPEEGVIGCCPYGAGFVTIEVHVDLHGTMTRLLCRVSPPDDQD